MLEIKFLTDHDELNLILVFCMSLDVEDRDVFLKFLGIFAPPLVMLEIEPKASHMLG